MFNTTDKTDKATYYRQHWKLYDWTNEEIVKACVYKTLKIISDMECRIKCISKEANETRNFTNMKCYIECAILSAKGKVDEYAFLSPKKYVDKQSLGDIIISKDVYTMSKDEIVTASMCKTQYIINRIKNNIICIIIDAYRTYNFSNVVDTLNDAITVAKQSVITEYASLRPNEYVIVWSE